VQRHLCDAGPDAPRNQTRDAIRPQKTPRPALPEIIRPGHLVDGALSLGPLAAGLSVGRGTDTCVSLVAMAAGVGLTREALPFPVMVIPTCSRSLLSPAKAIDESSKQKTKTNLHIFLAPSARSTVRFRNSGVPGWNGSASRTTCCRGSAKEQKKQSQLAFASTRI
jgi:hypothetical protein